MKPIIFISYSHKDEPEHPGPSEVQWLSLIRDFLRPAEQRGVFEVWVDQHVLGGETLDPAIEARLRSCRVFVLLVSQHSMASRYIIERELPIVRARQERGEAVVIYPIILSPTPSDGLSDIKDKNWRPRDGQPLSGFSAHQRAQHLTSIADELSTIAGGAPASATQASIGRASPTLELGGLPETPYERLVGREKQLARLDSVWLESTAHIVLLVAEGGLASPLW